MTQLKSRWLLVLALFIPQTLLAASFNFTSKSYEAAKKADFYVRFDMASTKIGIITTHFSGYAKTFIVMGELKDDTIAKGASLEFDVKSMDTDVTGRNEKMWGQCLDSDKHPRIAVTLTEPVAIDDQSKQISATINVRGEEFPLPLTVKANRTDHKIDVTIAGAISIKELKIPDPSIFIASVRDKIELAAHFKVTGK